MSIESAIASPPDLASAFRTWLMVGLRSFGGGPATLYLIRQAFVLERAWIGGEEFTRMWALCQLAPGINLLALAILIGRRLHGWRGAALAVIGLMLPSAAATVAITATYAHWQHAAWMQHALQGIVPATVGIGLATGIAMARPLVAASRREGAAALAVSALILAGSAAAALRYRAAALPIVLVCGLTGAIHRGFASAPPRSAARR